MRHPNLLRRLPLVIALVLLAATRVVAGPVLFPPLPDGTQEVQIGRAHV